MGAHHRGFVGADFDRLDVRVEARIDTRALHFQHEQRADLVIQKRQDLGVAVDEGNLGAERGKHCGVFAADDAGADDAERARDSFEGKNCVGIVDTLAVEGHVGGVIRRRTGGDQYEGGLQHLRSVRRCHFDVMGIAQHGGAVDDVDLVAQEIVADLFALFAHDEAFVEKQIAGVGFVVEPRAHAEESGLRKTGQVQRGFLERLRRDGAGVDPGAAESRVLFNQRDATAVEGGVQGRFFATRTGTDDNEIVGSGFGHGADCARSPSRGRSMSGWDFSFERFAGGARCGMNLSNRLRPWVGPLAVAVGLGVFGWFLRGELRYFSYREIVAAWQALPVSLLGVGALLTAGSYLLLVAYDGLALAHLGRSLGAARTGFASFTAFVVANNVGLGALGSGAVRLRLYGAWGLTAAEILTMQAFVSITFWLGLATTAGVAWLVTGGPMDSGWGRVAGGALTLVGPGYVALCARWRRPLRVWRWSFVLPQVKVAVAQVVLGATDIALAGTVLWVLLPAGFGAWGAFVALYAGALGTAVISHVPGGLGVLEAIVLMGRPAAVAADEALAGLVAFRVIYYLLPLGLAVVGLGWFELRRHRQTVADWMATAGRWLPNVAPRVLAVATFVAGALLLISGATPSERGRVAWLNDLMPLPVIETSHLLGSVVGVGLLLLARGLQRRLDAAYVLTLILLTTGMMTSLLKGADWEEALTLAVMLAALLPCRSFFDRRSTLAAEPFTPGWIVAIGLVIGGVTWLGFFAFRHIEYRDALWWRFAPNADAPRFLRAQLAGIVLLVAFGLHRLLRISKTEQVQSVIVAPEQLGALVDAARRTSAQLARLGDKEILLSRSGQAFLMFARSGRSWVALGDPVTESDAERRELIWSLRQRAEQAGGRVVFYQIDKDHLALYVDAGFGITKIGEEARMPLVGFSLAGGPRKGLRGTVNKLEREGAAFEWVEAAGVDEVMADLRRVSDDWLEQKSAREKGFSLGFFDETYLRRNPVALVRAGGKIVAFANVWCGAEREELSVDLMRHDANAPSGVMDYLFAHIMLRGAADGYRWFNLGMAPLAGMESHELAPISHRIATVIFKHADHFYGFQGLRDYKDKFDPVWEPRYMAVTGLWQLPAALADITSLIGGGLRGVFMK